MAKTLEDLAKETDYQRALIKMLDDLAASPANAFKMIATLVEEGSLGQKPNVCDAALVHVTRNALADVAFLSDSEAYLQLLEASEDFQEPGPDFWPRTEEGTADFAGDDRCYFAMLRDVVETSARDHPAWGEALLFMAQWSHQRNHGRSCYTPQATVIFDFALQEAAANSTVFNRVAFEGLQLVDSFGSASVAAPLVRMIASSDALTEQNRQRANQLAIDISHERCNAEQSLENNLDPVAQADREMFLQQAAEMLALVREAGVQTVIAKGLAAATRTLDTRRQNLPAAALE